MSSIFNCSGKFAGIGEQRSTPGGLDIADFELATKIKIPWKESYYSNIKITSCGELILKLKELKTGDKITVEGFIECVGSKNDKKINLIANKIIKGEK